MKGGIRLYSLLDEGLLAEVLMGKVNVGVIGVGTVGAGVAEILINQRELLRARTNLDLNLKTAVDINWDKAKGLDMSSVKRSNQADDILEDPDIDIVVETIGGYEPAFSFISKALKNKKHVVTANKALIASKGKELFQLAEENGVDLSFEASVGGGIPVIKGLREGLVANNIISIYGIVNGTCNYILTKMHQDGLAFSDALRAAQEKGFAEADPTLDIEGTDSAHKLTILAMLASSSFVDMDSIFVEGITQITKLDIDFAKSLGYTVKLLAIYRDLDGNLDLRVHPTLVPDDHLMASVNNELNAIFIKSDFVGDTMFYGPGAGRKPTASAIVSDIVDLGRDMTLRNRVKSSNRSVNTNSLRKVVPLDHISNRFYLRLYTYDAPGILAQISGILGEEKVSISSVLQLETHERDNYVPLVILTHKAPEKAMKRAVERIKSLSFVRNDLVYLRLLQEL